MTKDIGDPVWKKTVSAKNNGEFINVQSYSGYSLKIEDPEVPEYLLDINVPDEILGISIIEALKNSRFLPLEAARCLRLGAEETYQKWVKKMMERYNYKTKRALFKNMMNCSIECHEGIITIRPSHHEKLEAWSGDGLTEEDYVKILANSPPAEIGAALRLAFTRCTGLGAYSNSNLIT